MRKIPTKLRAQLEADPFYSKCCLSGIKKSAWAKIEWHHNLIYAGRQVNEAWCILPLEQGLHEKANEKWLRDLLDHIMLNRADEAILRKYSKAVDLIRRRDELNKQYGSYEKDIAVL